MKSMKISLYYFVGDSVTKYHNLGNLNTDTYFLTILEVQSLRSCFHWGCCLVNSAREGSVWGLCHCCVDGYLFPLSLHFIFPLCLSLIRCLLFIRVSFILNSGPTHLQYCLILTNYIYNNPTSKWGYIHRYCQWLQHIFWGDIIHPQHASSPRAFALALLSVLKALPSGDHVVHSLISSRSLLRYSLLSQTFLITLHKTAKSPPHQHSPSQLLAFFSSMLLIFWRYYLLICLSVSPH